MTEEKRLEISNSEQLSEVLNELSEDQIRFVIARLECNSDKEAALALDMKPSCIYAWRHHGAPLDEALRLMAYDGLTTALHIRRRNVAKAMAVKVAGLDSEDERIRQGTSTEIIEWEMGKAKQVQEITGAEGGPLSVRYVDNWRDPTAEAA